MSVCTIAPGRKGPQGDKNCPSVPQSLFDCGDDVYRFSDDFVKNVSLSGSDWNRIVSGSGTITQVTDRGQGWWRLRVGDPGGAAGTAAIITRVPIWVPANDPQAQIEFVISFPPGEVPEVGPAYAGGDACDVRSQMVIGITDRPDIPNFTPFGVPSGNGLFLEYPQTSFSPFCDPEPPTNGWHGFIVQNGFSSDYVICCAPSDDCTTPQRIQFLAKTENPGQGFGGVGMSRDGFCDVFGSAGDLNPGCEPNSLGSAYYAFVLLGTPIAPNPAPAPGPMTDYSGLYRSVAPCAPGPGPAATRPAAVDIDLIVSVGKRRCRTVGGTFFCPDGP